MGDRMLAESPTEGHNTLRYQTKTHTCDRLLRGRDRGDQPNIIISGATAVISPFTVICLAIVKDNAMPACDKCWRSGKLGLKMREVRSGARGEGGGRRKEDKMGSQWVGGCVGAWMGKRERERQSESESESENQVFMKTPPTLPRRMLRKGVVLRTLPRRTLRM